MKIVATALLSAGGWLAANHVLASANVRDEASATWHQANPMGLTRKEPNAISVPSLDPNAGIRKRARKRRFDARRVAAFDVLEVHCRTRQHLDAAFEDTARSANTGLVLIEALRGRISTHADIHAVIIAAPVGIVEQD